MTDRLKNSRRHYQKHLSRERKRRYQYYLKHKPDWRIRYMIKQYGITLEEYKKILKSQNYVCAICRQRCELGKVLCVDHDHKTGKIRGLLCTKHNKALGLFGDDLELLQEAINYIKKSNVNHKRN